MTQLTKNLVFLPGLLSDDFAWRHQLAILKESYSVQVIPLTDFSHPNDMVKHVLDVAPSEFILFGHSPLGGCVSLETTKIAPDRVKGLGLLNTTARAESIENIVWHERLIQKTEEIGFENLILSLLPIYLTPTDFCNATLHDELLAMFLRIGKDAFIRQQTAMIKRSGYVDYLAHIQCPTLIIHASNDVIMSYEMQEEMLNKIPHSHIEIVRECGHFSMLEKPQEVSQMITQWLHHFFNPAIPVT